jgi:phage-related protein
VGNGATPIALSKPHADADGGPQTHVLRLVQRIDNGTRVGDHECGAAVIFVLDVSSMVLLHGFTKTTQKTKKADLDTALQRKAVREKSR